MQSHEATVWPAPCLLSSLAHIEHQAVHRELNVDVRESSRRRRLMLFPFGHVECRARRRVVEGKVITDREESMNGENLRTQSNGPSTWRVQSSDLQVPSTKVAAGKAARRSRLNPSMCSEKSKRM